MQNTSADTFEISKKIIENNSLETLVYLSLFMFTWIVGGNILVFRHYRRLGKPWWSGLKPFAFPFKDFNSEEWLQLLLIATMSLEFGLPGICHDGC